MWWETEELPGTAQCYITKLEEQILLGFQQTSFPQTQALDQIYLQLVEGN